MEVQLLQASHLAVMLRAIRTSHMSLNKLDTYLDALGYEDAKLLKRVIELRHDSVLEHIFYTFDIRDISRALLQQLARHRHISMTVQSTRFTLQKVLAKLRRKDPTAHDTVSELCVIPPDIPEEQLKEFEKEIAILLKMIARSEMSNDVIKAFLPECFKTQLVLTTNARELAHIFSLRLKPDAYWEFRKLARSMLEVVYKRHPAVWSLLAYRDGYEDILEVIRE